MCEAESVAVGAGGCGTVAVLPLWQRGPLSGSVPGPMSGTAPGPVPVPDVAGPVQAGERV